MFRQDVQKTMEMDRSAEGAEDQQAPQARAGEAEGRTEEVNP